ncbi:hypothetical protein SAMN02745146_3516 [Hymenobacter daecheongensis DSM 21074]|uniref:Uncharacterized protein n=1 Tax=Hymenobacter daecheongensis DSM 21074 TaxID=1121955 RepID=A0A1M6KPL0_9BACT|nr:hypothetical protein [Hymenobacter daecheongensis]SHJ60860.1 hypothetical protein SAMN02745146_3516 [Hymenobacter daecheongensis DSM 21074]
MYTFERTDAFEIILAEVYEDVFVPLAVSVAEKNPNISLHSHILTGPGVQSSATGDDTQMEKSSIELEVFRHGKQILQYSLTYSDTYMDADEVSINAAFFRSIITHFYDTQEAATAAAQEALINFDFDAPVTAEDEAAWNALREFPIEPQILKAAVREDLVELLAEAI